MATAYGEARKERRRERRNKSCDMTFFSEVGLGGADRARDRAATL
jgi:hypothetical protein